MDPGHCPEGKVIDYAAGHRKALFAVVHNERGTGAKENGRNCGRFHCKIL
jgi:hypothetical protein